MSKCKVCLKPIVSKTRYEGYHNKCLRDLFGSEEVSPVLPFTLDEFMTNRRQHSKGMSISGAQAKLSAYINNNQVELTGSGGQYILKPTPQGLTELAENEHLSMSIAKLLAIDVPPFALLEFQDTGELCYIIKRFDRDLETGAISAQVEDMMQIMNVRRVDDGSKYESDYVTLGNMIKEATNNKVAPLRGYFNRLVHSFVVGNGDLHLKNISLIKPVNDPIRFYRGLSPHYDVVNSHIYDDTEHTFAMDEFPDSEVLPSFNDIGFETGLELRAIASRIGIPPPIVNKIIETTLGKEADILSIINSSFLSQEMKIRYAAIVKNRLTRLARS